MVTTTYSSNIAPAYAADSLPPMPQSVMKRDGRCLPFDRSKIVAAAGANESVPEVERKALAQARLRHRNPLGRGV